MSARADASQAIRDGGLSVGWEFRHRVLRQAVRENLVSFPSQVPVFRRLGRPELQARIVILYFVRGWAIHDIAARYAVTRPRVRQILTGWCARAVDEGYLQAIEADHPLFTRLELETGTHLRGMAFEENMVQQPTGGTSVSPASGNFAFEAKVRETSVSRPIGALTNVAQELHEIVAVLENQLQVRLSSLDRGTEPCGPLLNRAEFLCSLLEGSFSSISPNALRTRQREMQPISEVILATKVLLRRFQEFADGAI